MKVGIIGCGKIFPMHAYSIKSIPEVDLVAIADVNTEKLNKWTNQLNVVGYVDYQEMIDVEQLDAIHICTPHYLHTEMAIYALKKGIHVLTEKPAAIYLSDAQEMLKTQNEYQRALVISFQNRFNESSIFMREEYLNGNLGEFIAGKAYLTWSRSELYYHESGWKGTWKKEGGGLVIDQAIHTLDLVNWILDSSPKVSSSYLDNLFHPTIEVEDTAQIVLEFFEDKPFIFNGNNFYSEDSPILIELLFEQAKVNFLGDMVEIRYSNGKIIKQNTDSSEMLSIEGHKQYWGTSHLKQIQHFYDELLVGNIFPKNSLKECMTTQEVIEDVYDRALFSSEKR